MEYPVVALRAPLGSAGSSTASSPRVPRFPGAAILARALEGGEAPGALSRALAEADGDLRLALSRQGEGFRAELERNFGASAVAAALQLADEGDAQLFFEGLWNLGRELENRDRLPGAATVYGTLLAAARSFGSQAAEPVSWRRSFEARAQERLQTMRGEGSTGARFEFLSRRLAAQALDPAMLLGMTAAGMTFRLARVATLSRLAAAPTVSILTRGLLPRAIAYSSGMFAESLAFTAGVRGGNVLLGRPQDWAPAAVGREWAAGALTLVGLRATGALARGALRGLGPGEGLTLGLTRAVLPQAGMLGGILLSHRLETRLGLRPRLADGTELTDALATLLQFHVAGRLAHGMLGPQWSRLERGLDLQAEALARRAPLLPRFSGFGGPFAALAPAVAGHGVPRRAASRSESLTELMSKPLFMSSDPSDPKGPRELLSGRPLGGERASTAEAPIAEGAMTREQFQELWRTLRMTPNAELRRDLIGILLNEAQRSPEAVAFLMSVRDAEGNFHGRAEVLAQIDAGLRGLDVAALREFASGNAYALRSLLDLGKAGNARALQEIQAMDFSAYAETASQDASRLVEIASPLRYAFEGGNASARGLVQGLGEPVVAAIAREAERHISQSAMSDAAKAVQLLAVIGRAEGDAAVSALRQLREFPVELYENKEIEDPTVHSLYLMAQAGNATAAEVLSSIELYTVRPGSAGLLLKLYRYGSEGSFLDLKDLAEAGDLGAVSVLHDLALSGLRPASDFLGEMNPAPILREAKSSDRALYALGLISQHGNPQVAQAIGSAPGLANRLRGLLNADPYRLLSVVTPEMLIEQHASVVEGFDALPLRARESISRGILEAWQAEADKAGYYADNPGRVVTEDLIPRSFLVRLATEGVENYHRAGRETPAPRRSETRPSDRPGPKKPKRFVN